MTLLGRWVFGENRGGLGAGWGAEGASERAPDGCPGLQPAGLAGRQCYLLITNANYTIIDEHAAVVLSIAAAGGFGAGGKSKLCRIHVVWPGFPRRQSSLCLHPPHCQVFLISLLSKEKSGFFRDLNPVLHGFALCLPNSLPQSSPWCKSWPLAGLPVCFLAAETPALDSAQNPLPQTPLNNQVIFLTCQSLTWPEGFFFPLSPLNFQGAAAPPASYARCLGQLSPSASAPLNELLMSLQLLIGRADVPRAGRAAERDVEQGKASPCRERSWSGSGSVVLVLVLVGCWALDTG